MPPFSKPSVRCTLCLFLSLSSACLFADRLTFGDVVTHSRRRGTPPLAFPPPLDPRQVLHARTPHQGVRATTRELQERHDGQPQCRVRRLERMARCVSRRRGFFSLSLSRVACFARQLTLRERYIGQGPRALHRRRPVDVLDRPRQRHRRDAPPRRQECALRRRHQAG